MNTSTFIFISKSALKYTFIEASKNSFSCDLTVNEFDSQKIQSPNNCM